MRESPVGAGVDRFRVTNPFELEVELTYEVVETGEAGTIRVEAKRWGAPDVERTFSTTGQGRVRLSRDGRLVAEAANEGTACGNGP